MKIIGGKFKGRNFYMPKGIRATQNVVRKAVFDILGQDLEGQSFLELFAGSGAMGLEAMSRGASLVIFVEKAPRCAEILQDNVELFKKGITANEEEAFQVFNTDAFVAIKQLAQFRKKFDIIFLDPPYGKELAKKILNVLSAHDIVYPDSAVIIQHDRHDILPVSEGRFFISMERQYGSTMVSIYAVARDSSLEKSFRVTRD